MGLDSGARHRACWPRRSSSHADATPELVGAVEPEDQPQDAHARDEDHDDHADERPGAEAPVAAAAAAAAGGADGGARVHAEVGRAVAVHERADVLAGDAESRNIKVRTAPSLQAGGLRPVPAANAVLHRF